MEVYTKVSSKAARDALERLGERLDGYDCCGTPSLYGMRKGPSRSPEMAPDLLRARRDSNP